MQHKALVVESSKLFRSVIEKLLRDCGMTIVAFETGADALDAQHGDYAFIFVSRNLADISGEIFLKHYSVRHGLSNAIPVMITSEEASKVVMEANQAGFKLVFNKKHLNMLQEYVIRVLNSRTLNLDGRILYIEDDPRQLQFVSTLFDNKAIVDVADSFEKMKLLFEENNYDLVLSEYQINKTDIGDSVTNYIRNIDSTQKASTPILILTSETSTKKRTSYLRNGANDFIVKPFDSDELLVRASNLIQNYRLYLQVKKQEQELVKLALTDNLTGTYNRHSLSDLAPKYISNAQRHNTPLSLLVIDLDHFKLINDTHGHSTGDLVLKTVAGELLQACRAEDVVARFGGEEFVMLLASCDIADASHKAEQIREKIEACKPSGVTITASIGVTELLSSDDFATLFDRADKAVYTAKDNGRNQVMSSAHGDDFRWRSAIG